MVYQTAPFWVILNDLKPRFQGQAILMLNISEMANDMAIFTMEGE